MENYERKVTNFTLHKLSDNLVELNLNKNKQEEKKIKQHVNWNLHIGSSSILLTQSAKLYFLLRIPQFHQFPMREVR